MLLYLVRLRLFVGLELPASCREALAALDPGLPGLRWLSAENLHLTLSFLGEIAPERIDALNSALQHVHVPPFFLPLESMGCFESRGRPTTIWVGVGRGHPHLFALHKKVQDALLSGGFEPDLKPFQPHVTVGRAQEVSFQALRPLLRKHAQSQHSLFHVNRFVLFSSSPSLAGPSYKVEAIYDF